MTTDPRQRWPRTRELFDAALARAPEERAAFLAEACGDDEELLTEVTRLIAAADGAEDYFGRLARRTGALFLDDSPATSPPLPTDTSIGAYRLVRQVGRGGMGTVYLAERADGAFELQVAIKLLPSGGPSEGLARRFRAERQILASLNHPRIARLLDGGLTPDGTPYFVMEYVEGEPIDTYCDARRLSVNERLRLVLQVCDAVRHAHEAAVIHRDLKPGNILVTAAGRVKLLDFGIAKVLEGEYAAEVTSDVGASPLTLAFASPEQVAGTAVGVASDIYQLGLLLYRLLVGRGPFLASGTSPADVKRRIIEGDPTPPSEAVTADPDRHDQPLSWLEGVTPSELRQVLAGPLDDIILTALRREPAGRYVSVAGLAADLGGYLEGGVVAARPASSFYRARRFLDRHRRMAAVAFVSLALLTVAFVAPVMGRRATEDFPVSTRSSVAYGFYQEGLAAYYQGQSAVARPLFEAAVRYDSTFAMATLYLGVSTGGSSSYTLLEKARQLAPAATEWERLLIEAEWARRISDPGLLEAAERLVRRYPDDPVGYTLLAEAHLMSGEPLRAAELFEQSLATEAGSGRARDGRCSSCRAFQRLTEVLVNLDSVPAAERTAQRWIAADPESPYAWQEYAWTLWRQRRGEEALAARREAARRRSQTDGDITYPGVVAFRVGNYATADVLLEEQIRSGPPGVQRMALFWYIISLRHQGRLAEALEATRHHGSLIPDWDVWGRLAAPAQVLFELGRVDESLAKVDSAAVASIAVGTSSVRDGAHHAWILTYAATSANAIPDTARLKAIADTMGILSQRSGSAFAQSLQFYVLGLIEAARNDDARALEMFAQVDPAWAQAQFVRARYEQARVLLRLGRPEEAITLLQAGLRGPSQSRGFSITATELRELLGMAWEAAGQPDSAAFQYQSVLRAWARADAELQPRRAEVERRLRELEMGTVGR